MTKTIAAFLLACSLMQAAPAAKKPHKHHGVVTTVFHAVKWVVW